MIDTLFSDSSCLMICCPYNAKLSFKSIILIVEHTFPNFSYRLIALGKSARSVSKYKQNIKNNSKVARNTIFLEILNLTLDSHLDFKSQGEVQLEVRGA